MDKFSRQLYYKQTTLLFDEEGQSKVTGFSSKIHTSATMPTGRMPCRIRGDPLQRTSEHSRVDVKCHIQTRRFHIRFHCFSHIFIRFPLVISL